MYQKHRYRDAAWVNRQAFELALKQESRRQASHFLANLASCAFALFNYRQALGQYLEARELALSEGDAETAAGVSLNLSSLHLQMGALDSAAAEAEKTQLILRGISWPKIGPHLLFQLGKIKTRREGIGAAHPLLSEAIDAAEAAGNRAIAAQVWNYTGYELMRAGRLREADTAMSNAFRIRKLGEPRELGNSYRTLSLLKLQQGEFALANDFAGLALKNGRQHQDWMSYYCRARVKTAQNRTREALADYRIALDLARRLRLEVVPSDAHRTGVEVELRDLYDSFIETLGRMAVRTGARAPAAEAFRAAEEARASSLRALMVGSGRAGRMAPEYGEVLADLRTAEVKLLAGFDREAEAEARRLRHRLSEIEIGAGLRTPPVPDDPGWKLDEALAGRLTRDQAFIAFHVGERESYVWAITRNGVEIRPLPARRELAVRTSDLVRTVRSGASTQSADAEFGSLFAGLSSHVQDRPEWILALEDALFQAPLAAVQVPGRGRLVDRHSLRLVPSAHFLFREKAAPSSGIFVGVGDPVYNHADPRARGYLQHEPPLEYPRLAAGAREVRSCAAAWGTRSPVLLEGTGARRGTLLEALENRPAILHFATHMFPPALDSTQGGILLALRANGAPDLLTAADIAAVPCSAVIVTLSGCSSAGRQMLPGSGLAGLTRAWIAAGARTVVASLWPTTDSDGVLFRYFYERLRGGDAPAEALRQAQLENLRSGRLRSREWAAYVVVGD